MKKIKFTKANIFTILIVSCCLFLPVSILAQEIPIQPLKSVSDSNNLKTESVNYTLPYPGLPPDNPLYFLKATRDHIIRFLISDPLKKAEFDLLQADKRLSSGANLALQRPQKADLISQTISKGNNYFLLVLSDIKTAKQQGEDIKDIVGRLILSTKKHEEVLKNLSLTSSIKLKESLNNEEKRVEDFNKTFSAFVAE